MPLAYSGLGLFPFGLLAFTFPDSRYHRAVIGHRIRQLRIRRNLSQAALADVLGYQQSWVSKAERGRLALTGSQIRAMALVLGTSTDDLLRMQ